MAIVQISQITNRLGLQADLPQLAGAEFGWSTDTRQLFIGNGTLAEGAPVIGNTEILTEFSDILNIAASYTYKGTAAGYTVQTGPTLGSPVVLSLQNWMDQWASVKDFGATGDGSTDDTAAINRALNQLYCQNTSPASRRALFFPAGTYKVSSTINIPTNATLYGEGPNNSIIQLVNANGAIPYVAQTADSLQQTGVNIGNGGAISPTNINIINMAFESADPKSSVFLAQTATNCEFKAVGFYGLGTTSTLNVDTLGTTCVDFGSTNTLTTTNVLFDGCRFSGCTYGVNTSQITKGVVFNNSSFNILYQGIVLEAQSPSVSGPTGTRITNNIFDNVFREGIKFGAYVALNVSGYNVFYNVANDFAGTTNPTAPVIQINGDNNASVGDMFERSDSYATTYPQVFLNASTSIATTNGSQIQLGTKTVNSGNSVTLLDNEGSETEAFTVNVANISSFKIDYSISQGILGYRTGSFWVTKIPGTGTLTYTDDYNESGSVNITLSATQTDIIDNTVSINYTSVPTTGRNSVMNYSISYFN